MIMDGNRRKMQDGQRVEPTGEEAIDMLEMQELVGDVKGVTTMVTKKREGDIIERHGWLVRKWKGQAWGIEQNGDQTQQLGRNKKKRTSNMEELAVEGEQRKKE